MRENARDYNEWRTETFKESKRRMVAVAIMFGFVGAGQIESAEETLSVPTAVLEENNIDE